MPLYELVCIAQRFNTAKNALPLQALVTETSKFIHEAGGAVRRTDAYGLKSLPQRARKDGKWHNQGDLWTLWFDSNPRTLNQLHEKLRTDPRVLKYTTIRKGITLEELTAELPWGPGSDAIFAGPRLPESNSTHSANANFPSTISYPPPSRIDANIARKQTEGTTSRAQSQAIEAAESMA
ncbi:hypothetical protein P389DRAFT_154575 [Cystobasidium minutum MCA 4210]|uniref:uncharacterized protein n=1 Tax=Cystobasidium minutum MCA 4210 TaxID=1397322 RepID=UPI0034CFE29A|eukprot:jgi/Rhomi1/154575/estExt_Genewise1.C_6_t10162